MITNYQTRKNYQIIAVIVGTLIYGYAVTTFLRPAGIMPGGLSGLSQVLSIVLPIPPGILLVFMNIPILIFGWKNVSRLFTMLSGISIFITMTAFDYFRFPNPIENFQLSILFGSLLAGFGIGLALRFGGSMGGIDIISNFFSIKKGQSIAKYNLMVNAGVVFLSGIVQQSFEKALFTFISMFIVTEVINHVHTRHEKMMMLIITDHEEVVVDKLLTKLNRGITIINGVGGYSKKEKKVLMVTVSSYQLYVAQHLVLEADHCAFINVLPVKKVIGNFVSSVSY